MAIAPQITWGGCRSARRKGLQHVSQSMPTAGPEIAYFAAQKAFTARFLSGDTSVVALSS